MFVKNNIFLLFLTFFVFPFSSNENVVKKNWIDVAIPKIEYQETIKEKNLVKTLEKAPLEQLSINDKITIKKEEEIYYYKIISKYYCANEKMKNDLNDGTSIVLKRKVSNREEYLILIAKNIGKMVKI